MSVYGPPARKPLGCDVLRHTSSTIHLSRISVVRSSSRCTHAQPHLHSLGASRSMLCHVSAVRPAVCCAASSSSSSSNTSRRHLRHTPVQSMSGVAAPYVLSAAAAGQSEGGSPVASSEQQQHQHQQRTVQQEHAHLTHLVSLSVRDFALVSNSHVQLHPGLTAISGSSGAGKSALIEALSVLLGSPPPGDCVRPPAAAAVIEGSWWLAAADAAAVRQLLLQAGLSDKALPQLTGGSNGSNGSSSSGSWLHLRREVAGARAGSPTTSTSSSSSSSGRSRVLVNGVPTSLRVVRSVADVLVDVNGQAASLALRDTHQQLLLLDRIAGVTHLRQELSAAIDRLSDIERKLSQLDALGDDEDRAALQKRIDLIERARLQPAEDAQLRRRLAAMEARRGCLETAATLQAALQGDGSSSSSSSSRSAAAGGVGGTSLLEGVGLVMLQLRGLLSTEEQQRRLLLAERRQLRATAGSSSGSNGGSERSAGGNLRDYFPDGEEDEGSDDEFDNDGDDDDDDDDSEVTSSAAGLSALRNALEELEAVEDALREAHLQISSYASAVDYSAAEAASISSRLDLITKLCRRFRCTRGASGLLDLQEQWSEQLEQYYASQGQAESWQEEADQLQDSITDLALKLSEGRVAAAGRLAAAVQAQLGELVMGNSRFAVRLDWTTAQQTQLPSSQAVLVPTSAQPPMEPLTAQHAPQQQQQADSGAPSGAPSSSSRGAVMGPEQLFRLSPAGLDTVTFLLAAGPSEPLRPLADVASGGEAARVMLALKAAAAAVAAGSSDTTAATAAAGSNAPAMGQEGGPPPVLVLDELDAGVGSRLGAPIGRLLQRLVAGKEPTASQVLVVTHTPQVAACATQHIQALKGPGPDGRIISTFRSIENTEERLAELADMMGLLPQQQQQQQQNEETMRAKQLAAQLLAAAQEGSPGHVAAGSNGGSNDGSSSGSSSDSSVFEGLSAAAAAAGAAAIQQGSAGSQEQHPQQQH